MVADGAEGHTQETAESTRADDQEVGPVRGSRQRDDRRFVGHLLHHPRAPGTRVASGRGWFGLGSGYRRCEETSAVQAVHGGGARKAQQEQRDPRQGGHSGSAGGVQCGAGEEVAEGDADAADGVVQAVVRGDEAVPGEPDDGAARTSP